MCESWHRHIDPASRQKTLIFCVTDAHADMVVHLLKKAFERTTAVSTTMPSSRSPAPPTSRCSLIRRYKNERQPNVAVTVDLLTTGIDVPEICNLVFLRRVNSRILYDQMLGRATRRAMRSARRPSASSTRCRSLRSLQDVTGHAAGGGQPAITFTQLARGAGAGDERGHRALVRDQFVAKLQRKKRHLTRATARDFETCAGMTPEAFIEQLKTKPGRHAAGSPTPRSRPILDRQGEAAPTPVFESRTTTRLVGTERGYGRRRRPEDYLEFSDFVRNLQQRHSPSPRAQRPRELTRSS